MVSFAKPVSPFDEKFHNYLFGDTITRSQSVQSGIYERKRSLDSISSNFHDIKPKRSSLKSSAPSFEKLPDEFELERKNSRAVISSAKTAGRKSLRNPRNLRNATPKGLMTVISSANSSPTRTICNLQSVNSSSLDIIYRRDRSFSPGNKQQSVSNLDITGANYLIPSPLDQKKHKKGAVNFHKSEKRVSRVSSLSPIIGTPNKSDYSDANEETSNTKHKTSRVTSSMSSLVNTLSNTSKKTNASKNKTDTTTASMSRSSSPPTKSASKANSKPNSRPTSRADSRQDLKSGTAAQSPQKSPILTKKPPMVPKKSKSSGKMSVMASFTKKLNKISMGSDKSDKSSTKNTTDALTSKKSSPKQISLFKSSSTGALKQKIANPSQLKKIPSFKLTRKKKDVATSVQENMLKHDIQKQSTASSKKDIAVSANLDNNSVGKLKKSNSTLSKSTSSVTLLSKKESQSSIKSGKSTPAQQRKFEKKLSSKTLIKTDSSGKLVKKGSSRSLLKADIKDEKTSDNSVTTQNNASVIASDNENSSEKLVALTKNNVVSMTTAAITSQPLQIQTTLTNHMPSTNHLDRGSLMDGSNHDGSTMPASAILEKSQKTLENIQKAVNDATDEIQKTINENLSNLKSMEQNIQRGAVESNSMMNETLEAKKNVKTSPATPRMTLTARNSKLDLQSINENSELRSNKEKTHSKSIKSSDGSSLSTTNLKDAENNNNNAQNNNNNNSIKNNNNNNNFNNNNNNNLTNKNTNENHSISNKTKMNNNYNNKDELLLEKMNERAISVPPEVENQSGNMDKIDSISQKIENRSTDRINER
jgi:hypothetical protein